MQRLLLAVTLVAIAITPVAPDASAGKYRRDCRFHLARGASLPGWARFPRRTTVVVDSVMLGGFPALRGAMPCWRMRMVGRPALMVRAAERELRQRRHVGRLVIVAVGYNSLWERGRRNYGRWSERFDAEARALLHTLRARGAKQFVWVKLREPRATYLGSAGRGELGKYSWYFPYVNERLRRIDKQRKDLVLADWTKASRRPGLTYDSIHLNPASGAPR